MTSAVRWRFFLNFLSCTRKVILTCWRSHDGEMARHIAVIRLQCHVLSGKGCSWGNHRRCPPGSNLVTTRSFGSSSLIGAGSSVGCGGSSSGPPEAAAASAAPASAAAVVTPPAAPRPADSRCANHHHEPAVRPGHWHLCFEEESVPWRPPRGPERSPQRTITQRPEPPPRWPRRRRDRARGGLPACAVKQPCPAAGAGSAGALAALMRGRPLAASTT